jgi:hypothetical protein
MRPILSASIILLLTSCASSPLTSNAYQRCNLSQEEWELLSDPPKNMNELIELTNQPLNTMDFDFIWFSSSSNKIALCRSQPTKSAKQPHTASACGSSRWQFEYTNGQWHGGGIGSIYVCHG